MKRLPILYLLVLLFTTQFACNLFSTRPTDSTQVVPSVDGTPPGEMVTSLPSATAAPVETLPAAKTPSSGRMDLALLKNFTYWLEDFKAQAVLENGVFDDEEIHSRLVEPVAFGDLNGDGREDAAVILATNSGGSGTFYDLIAVLDQDGTPEQSGSSYIGDRQVIKNLQIAGGRIILDYLTQGLTDPSCCPNEHRLRSYLLENGEVSLASEQVFDSPEAQATPLPNAILIDEPSMDDPLTIPQQVRGRVSQVPPEMKLVYYVTDLEATLLMQGEVPLEGEPGGPGSIAFEFTLDEDSPGLIQVELVDSADGILRGRSIVILLTP